ncbi:MAG: preprotein translocase subunit SecE [Desulfonauticus sp.]|nr:preprotein translocase subunit SecE [Desulfonauticus sp.]
MEKIKNIFSYIKEAKRELEKVIFPTFTEVRQGLIAVVSIVAVVTMFLSLVDLIMSGILKTVL